MIQYLAIAAGVLVAAAILVWFVMNAGSDDRSARGRGLGRTDGEAPEESEVSTQRRNWILGVSGSVEEKSFHVGERTVTIGRKPTNFVQVADSEASRVHCQIRGRKMGASLVDMESSAGTTLNGEKLRPDEEYQLEDGDHFEVASAAFEYRLTGDFEENYGITAQKTTGQKFETSTELGAGPEWRESIEQALDDASGDPEQAAEILGVDLEVFMQLMDQTDIGRD